MAIPDFQSVMRPVLQAVGDGVPLPLSALRVRIADVFKLTEEERKERLPSGNQTVINNRVGWARTYLNKAGLLTIPNKGMVQITVRGREALASGPERITVSWLKQFPEFADFHTAKPQVIDAAAVVDSDLAETTPDEQLAEAYQALQQSLADELLAQVRAATPSFFEQVVVDLMIAMGYGGSRKEAGKATQLTNDDGIDGIIKEDKLGLDVIYLQAKRWANTVHRPEIDKFIGALTRKRARKGVFITTSDFSTGAKDAALGLDIKVVLIDGIELARLMVEHNLGVSVKQVYEVKQIDSDYFSEE
ncbi:restriction endonuclease [Pseudomonas sp. Choline-3u-10]|jgi:restriction system protein|uniref:restriction endonuclease n=1 Tax=Pseudomonadaceae TaxID=135621 RepID=UPI000617AA64|nr:MULTISPECIES: restriction endonuclease [Pseudomonadaceae]MBU0948043.1 restriction endonuclease [Gammaproteobacteria bacterium]HBM10335.1 restriction endonuclease [Pseudomonas sp.]KJJ61512.1 restriction endonuclease [Pseudomonas sp. 10B238]MBK3796222.1 restriction endonuclease [Stutzerimonas stutzeri]MBK3876725.1 restriction endonuclease [Stutzerimonas stutzeri]|tara:strand:+ start:918 stop:1829 length:912 start_codon:yes stop_codon:yes gene_type:complete